LRKEVEDARAQAETFKLEAVAAASEVAAAQEKQVQWAEILRNVLSARECDHNAAMAQLGEMQLRSQEAEKAAAAARASVIDMASNDVHRG
jgi:hypothetical protein